LARYLGPYEIIRELGSGPSGTVYLAEGEIPEGYGPGPRRRRVAIKKLSPIPDRTTRERLRRELDLLMGVRHRGIAACYAFDEREGAVVSEYVQGTSLRSILDGVRRVREKVFVEAAIEIGSEVAEALQHAYFALSARREPLQLLHRGLRPENIMLTPEGEVKVLDFAVAGAFNTLDVQAPPAKGSAVYGSPEQAGGRLLDHRSDLYILGLVLFELTMERPAFSVPETAGRDAYAEVLKRLEKGELATALRELESRLPGPGPVIARCLQPNPKARLENGTEVAADFRRNLFRERGAYIREFAQYFHDRIQKLEDAGPSSAPKPSSPVQPPPASEPSRGDSMSSSSTPPRPGGPPRPGSMPSTPAQAGGPPRPGALPSTPPMPGGPPRPGGPPGPPRPPGPPAVAAPPAPPARPSPSAPAAPAEESWSSQPQSSQAKKKSSARAPDETGMLRMEELRVGDLDDDDPNGGAPSSATQFFAIPAQKKKGEAALAPPPKFEPTGGRALPGASAPGFAKIAGPGGAPPPVLPGPSGGPMAIGGPIAAGPIAAGPIASGPVAGAPTFAQSGAGAGSVAPPPPAEENRSSSARVFVIILGLLGMVFVVCVVAVAAIVIGLQMQNKPEEAEVAATKPGVVEASPDEGADEDEAPVVIPDAPKPKPRAPKSVAAVPAGDAPPPPPPKPKAAFADLTVKMPTEGGYNRAEVSCEGGGKLMGKVSGGTAVIANVPTGGTCTLFLKGAGAPAPFKPVRGGQSLSCTVVDTTARCK
jgi:serine/threonine protein kinase